MVNQDKFIEYSPKLYDLGHAIAEAYRTEIRRVDAVATGRLVNFNYDVTFDDGVIRLSFDLPNYWYFVDFGRKETVQSGKNDLKAKIAEWIDNKGIIPRDGISKDSLAFLITRKIHEQGYKGRNPFQNMLNNTITERQDFIETAKEMVGSDLKSTIVADIANNNLVMKTIL